MSVQRWQTNISIARSTLQISYFKNSVGGLTLGQEAGAAERVTEMALPQAPLWQDSQRTVFSWLLEEDFRLHSFWVPALSRNRKEGRAQERSSTHFHEQ